MNQQYEKVELTILCEKREEKIKHPVRIQTLMINSLTECQEHGRQ